MKTYKQILEAYKKADRIRRDNMWCRFIALRGEFDDDGLIPLSLEEVLRGDTVKLVYLVPTFQNPTGYVSLGRRPARH